MKVSVIVTCYNLGAYLEECLESAMKSTCSDFEVIVVDDGSTDPETVKTVARLEKLYSGDDRVRFIRQSNKGVSAARNTGIAQARGECILPLDADNRIRPQYLTRAVQVMTDDPSIGVVYAWAERFGIRTGAWEFPPFDRQKMLLCNCVESCSAFRKRVWVDNNGYDESRFREGYEDWDFWLGAIEHGWRFHRIQEVLFDYRVRSNSMVSACNEPAVRQKLVTQLIEKHKTLYSSCWPDLLISRELTTLEYERLVAGYHQRFVESLVDFQRVAADVTSRCKAMESDMRRVRAILAPFLLVCHLRDVVARWWAGRRRSG
ncbi:MAG: glycosyltransferase family A protein [bacterium]